MRIMHSIICASVVTLLMPLGLLPWGLTEPALAP